MNYYTYIDDPTVKQRKLNVSPAAQSKSEYIIQKLKDIKEPFSVITLARTANEGVCYPEVQYTNQNGIRIKALKDEKYKSGLRKYISSIRYHFRILKQFLQVNKGDTIIVYHSLNHAMELCIAKKIRGFKLILEVEEIYQDVVSCGKMRAYWERKAIKAADGYILSTETLSKVIQPSKPYIVVNGTYHAEPKRNVGFNDDKIHCVYAGTFEPAKGSATAVAAAGFLPENYHVHILGFGTEEQIENTKTHIRQVQERTKCTISYDGLKTGEEYIQFLQKCHIGLCTQGTDVKYTETSFPSKILGYLANGLRVLAARISVVVNSEVGDALYYYDSQEPQEMAKAITNIPINEDYDSRHLLNELDMKCGKNLKQLLEQVKDELN